MPDNYSYWSTRTVRLTELIDSGSTDQQTVHENSTAFAKYRLCPRALRNVANGEQHDCAEKEARSPFS
jgi:hypothetical protein